LINLTTLCKEDFYFNGAYLSTYKGIVGSQSGFTAASLLPSREHIVERINGVDGGYLASTRLSPRTLIIPIYIYDLSNANLRAIAAWLDVTTAKAFYWKSDTGYLMCIPDQEAIDLSDVYNNSGVTELKFIAYDPYFYQVTPSNSTHVLTTGTNNIDLTNVGNRASLPKMKIYGSGDVTVSIYVSTTLVSTFTATGISGNFEVDTLYKTIYAGSTNKINDMTGSFLQLPASAYTIRIVGAVTSLELTPRYRWI
jgi:predicted phage tail component-like protein